jgi:hypothetical protein
MCSGLGSFNPVPFFTRGKFIDRAVPTMPNPIRQAQGKVDSSGRPIEKTPPPPPPAGTSAAERAELRRRQAVVEAAARRLRGRRGLSFLTRQPGMLDAAGNVQRPALLSP